MLLTKFKIATTGALVAAAIGLRVGQSLSSVGFAQGSPGLWIAVDLNEEPQADARKNQDDAKNRAEVLSKQAEAQLQRANAQPLPKEELTLADLIASVRQNEKL